MKNNLPPVCAGFSSHRNPPFSCTHVRHGHLPISAPRPSPCLQQWNSYNACCSLLLGGSAEFGAEPRHEPAKRGSISRNRRHEPHLRGCWFREAACRNQKNALLKRLHLTQHRAAAARSAHRHTPPRQRGHATGPVSVHRPPEGRHASSGHIRARLEPALYHSSFVESSSVAHAHVRVK